MFRKKLFRQFISNQTGGVIIFTAFGSLIILTAVAAAVDYSQMVAIKARLQTFSDSAALSATKSASNYMFSHLSDSSAQTTAQQIAETTALQSVRA